MASQAGSTWAASTTCSTGGRAGRSPCSTTHCKIDKRRRLYTFFLTRLLTFSSSLVTPSPFIRMLQEQLYSSREFIFQLSAWPPCWSAWLADSPGPKSSPSSLWLRPVTMSSYGFYVRANITQNSKVYAQNS